jgi:hypothetical protein
VVGWTRAVPAIAASAALGRRCGVVQDAISPSSGPCGIRAVVRRCAVNREVVRREAAEHLGELDHDRLYQRPVMMRSSRPWSDA